MQRARRTKPRGSNYNNRDNKVSVLPNPMSTPRRPQRLRRRPTNKHLWSLEERILEFPPSYGSGIFECCGVKGMVVSCLVCGILCYSVAIGFTYLLIHTNDKNPVALHSHSIERQRRRQDRHVGRRDPGRGTPPPVPRYYQQPCDASFHEYRFSIDNGCVIHPIHERPHCQFQHLQISLTSVSSVRRGGEPFSPNPQPPQLQQQPSDTNTTSLILGQPASYEVLQYGRNTFLFSQPPIPFHHLNHDDDNDQDTNGRRFFYDRPTFFHYINDIFLHAKVLDPSPSIFQCPKPQQEPTVMTLPGLTLLVARESYANFYHAVQMWWNAYFTLIAGSSTMTTTTDPTTTVDVHLIFLDAHPHTPLDDVWSRLFAHVTYLQRDYHFQSQTGHHNNNKNTMLCLEQVRLIPPGTNAPFAVAGKHATQFIHHCPNHTMTRQFVHHVLERYNVTQVQQIPGRVVVIDRLPYLAHPRSNPQTIERAIPHLANVTRHVLETAFASSSSPTRLSLQVVALETLSMQDQLRLIRQAQVLVGNHGAGLTHTLFLQPHSHVLELSCRRLFFQRLAEWNPNVTHSCLKPLVVHHKDHSNQTTRATVAISPESLADYLEAHVVPILRQVLLEHHQDARSSAE